MEDKVLKVLKELNYEKNIIASTLAYNRTLQIGVLHPHFKDDPFWEQPYNGIQKAYKSVEHYGLKLKYYHFEENSQDFVAQTKKVLIEKIDALIIAPNFFKESETFLKRCEEKRIPYIQINAFIPRNSQYNLGYIGQNSYQSGVLAGKLFSYGLKQDQSIAVIHLEKGLANAQHLIEKEKGVRDFFSKDPLSKHSIFQLSYYPFDRDNNLYQFLDDKLLSIPNLGAILVTTSRAYLIAQYLEDRQIKPLQLIGFDLIDKNIQFLKKGKISFLINQNPFHQGYYAMMRIAEHLLKKCKKKKIQNLSLDIVIKENCQHYLEETEELLVFV